MIPGSLYYEHELKNSWKCTIIVLTSINFTRFSFQLLKNIISSFSLYYEQHYLRVNWRGWPQQWRIVCLTLKSTLKGWRLHCAVGTVFFFTNQLYNNIARGNLIDTKYRQMAFWSPSDVAPISPIQQSFGTPGQTKVSDDRQRETIHDICCYTSQLWISKERTPSNFAFQACIET
jgi:hypothetical protein